MYPIESKFPVYCHECFYSDKWDSCSYGQDTDWSTPFFDQFKNLLDTVPRINLIGINKVNSDYSNHVTSVKNCYLCFSTGGSEDCFYVGPQCVGDKNCCSCSMTRNSEWSYMLVDCEQCYRVSFSQNSKNCIDSTFLYNCRNCQDCLGCTNLRNKNYCILNEQYSKEDYFKKKKELILDTFMGFDSFKKEFEKIRQFAIRRYAVMDNTQDCTGDNVVNSINCKDCYVAVDSENSRYGFICNSAKDCMDVCHTYPSSELSYFSMAPIESNKILFSSFIYANCFNLLYCDNCYTTQESFGSISLKNKSYCILNKQYSKEEYLDLKDKLIKHMNEMPYLGKNERVYKFGDFFPFEISPFAYNETPLQEYFPLSKEEALDKGYKWREPEKKSYNISIKADDFHSYVFNAEDQILKETIECEHKGSCAHNCSKAFRILPDELHIYKALKVPIPRTCPNCRHADRIKERNPMKLWHRICMCDVESHGHEGKCEVEFETSYAPDRPEKVYCEKCYQQEVY